MVDSQNPFIIIEYTDTATESFPVEYYKSEVDPVDFIIEDNYTSKPHSQSNSKHAFPFGAQISTPCTYGVF